MFNLKTEIKINNIKYPINTDFRLWLKFQKIIKELKNDEESFINLLSFFIEVGLDFEIKFFNEVLEECTSFFIGETRKNNLSNNSNDKKIFDFEVDEKYIFSAFLQEYKIDLYNIEYLHWHKFKSLLESLSDECQLSKIIQYRNIELSKIKDKEQKKFYKKMKEIYSLENQKDKMTTEEYHESIYEQVNRRFKEIEEITKRGCKNE